MTQSRDQKTARIEALFNAIEKDDLKMLKSLTVIDDQNIKNADGRTLIRFAAYNNKIDIVDYLLNEIIYISFRQKKTINKNDQFQLGTVVLLIARDIDNPQKSETMTKRLFECGALDCSASFNDTKKNALHIVARKDIEFKKTFELLLKHASWDQINLADTEGKLPLDYASLNGNAEFARMLIEQEKKKINEFLVPFFILFRASKPFNCPDILKIIAAYLSPRLATRIEQFHKYNIFLKANCILESYKKHNLLPLDNTFLVKNGFRSQSSVNLMKNFQQGINDKSIDGLKESTEKFLNETIDQKKFGSEKDHYATSLLIKYSFISEKAASSNTSTTSSTMTTTLTSTTTTTTTQTLTSDLNDEFEHVNDKLSGRFNVNF